LPQLTENSQYRTNIVLTNAGTSSATVKVELYDGSGAKLGEYTETLNAGEFKQKVQPFKSVANQTNLSRGYAKVTVVAGSGVMALASVVDNVTNDPTTVRVATATGLGAQLAALPANTRSNALATALGVLERGWVANAGQWDKRAAFSAPGYFGTTWVTKDGELRHVASKEDCEKPTSEAGEPEQAGTRFRKPCPVQSWVLAERWVGGKVKGIRGEEELETKVSYFLGNDPAKHRSGLPSYRSVSLGEVWPGVEVKLKASQKTVEKLFYLRPGANLGKVRVELRGANRLRLSQEGELVIETGLGELKLSKPVAWQEKDGQKLPVQASYRLSGKNRYGFAVHGADPSLPLVIDPILQATYLGGSDLDEAFALAMAGNGEVYVAGRTNFTDFPNTAGGAQPRSGGSVDGFVARLNPGLTSVLQSSYLGGSHWDEAFALALAPSGEVYVAGITTSSDFPNTAGGAQAKKGGGTDAFVARLNAT
jgi:hypothetical protein